MSDLDQKMPADNRDQQKSHAAKGNDPFWHILLLVAGGFGGGFIVHGYDASHPPCKIYFAPDGHPADAIVAQIDRADRSIYVQAYWFTSDKITKALIKAMKRNVIVKVIADMKYGRNTNPSKLWKLNQAGIEVYLNGDHTECLSDKGVVS